MPPVAVTGQ